MVGKIKNKSVLSGARLYSSVFQKVLDELEEKQSTMVKNRLAYYHHKIQVFRIHLTKSNNNKRNKTARLIEKLKDYESKIESLNKGLDESFMLFVVGTGKYGKSTLINSLLGTKVADVDVLPKTWKIDIFRKDIPSNKVMIKYRNNTEKQVSVDEAKIIISSEENKRKKSESIVATKRKEMHAKTTSFEAYKEFKLKLEREELYKSDIVEMHWGMTNIPILEDFYVVDTPGLTQKIMGEVRNNVQDYYHKADGVLWMLDATSIAASNAKKLVESLEESLAEVGGKQQSNIIAVLNRMDLIYESEGWVGVNRVLADARKIYKGYFRAIIPFSATKAFEGSSTNNADLIELSGLSDLQKEIHQAFYKNAKWIQHQKKLESGFAYNIEVSALVKEYIQSLNHDLDFFYEEEVKVRNHIEKEMIQLKKHGEMQLNSYKKKVEANISSLTESFLNTKGVDAQKRFVDNKIFEMRHLRKVLKEFQREENQRFTNLTNLHMKKLYFTEYPNLQKQTQLIQHENFKVNVEVKRDQDGEDLMTYGSGVAAGLVATMFLGPLGLLVGGLVGWFAKNNIRDELRRSLYREIEKMVTDLSNKIKEEIDSHGDSAYEEVISSALLSFMEVYGFENSKSNEEWDTKISKTITRGTDLVQILSNQATSDINSSLIRAIIKG